MKILAAGSFAVLLATLIFGHTLDAVSCESLASLMLPNARITLAQTVPAGGFLPAGAVATAAAAQAFRTLPAFCRIAATLTPSSDSDIKVEVWLPASGWNGKFLAVGNGGLAGYIDYVGLVNAVGLGYAGSSTDTGHRATDGKWWLGHPEKVTDFGYRAIHETAVKSKAIIRALYGANPEKSYFDGCSNGGRQGLMETQRYPADYDGIIAGAGAALKTTHIMAGVIWNVRALETPPAAYIPPTQLPAIERAVLAACDGLDGVQDGVLEDPRMCHYDPDALLCSGAQDDSCLTLPQVAALRKIYNGPRTSKGEHIWPGLQPGGEGAPRGWRWAVTGTGPGTGFGHDSMAGGDFLGFSFDYKSFDFDRDVPRMDEQVGGKYNPGSPNLKDFKNRGGKLILYHGWSDAAVPPTTSIEYYQALVAKQGQKDVDAFVRLYMVPGMQHCVGGPGPNSFSMFAALEQWSEKRLAPAEIVATKFKIDGRPSSGVVRTRPLCPYPQVARYSGSGSTDYAGNFACLVPPKK